MANTPETGNGRRATGDRLPTGNRQQATGNGQRGDLRWGSDIAARLIYLAAEVIRLVRTLPKDVTGRHIAEQLVRAATSGGANYEEARAAESRADFIHKVGVAAKELRETAYWLRLVDEAALTTTPLKPLISESLQLVSILMASKRTALENSRS
jgi:four helix bundle protein